MQSHSTGPIMGTRQGALSTMQTAQFSFAGKAIGSTNMLLMAIDASPTKPVGMRLVVVEDVVFVNGANAVTLSVGFFPADTGLLNAVDLKAALGTNYAPANPIRILTTFTEIWGEYINAVTAATAGQATVFIELFEVNITPPTINDRLVS